MRSDCSRLDGLSPGLGVFVCVCAGEGTDRLDVLRVGAWLALGIFCPVDIHARSSRTVVGLEHRGSAFKSCRGWCAPMVSRLCIGTIPMPSG